jgi:hypothetical protein
MRCCNSCTFLLASLRAASRRAIRSSLARSSSDFFSAKAVSAYHATNHTHIEQNETIVGSSSPPFGDSKRFAVVVVEVEGEMPQFV